MAAMRVARHAAAVARVASRRRASTAPRAAAHVAVPELVGLLVDLGDAAGEIIRKVTRGGDLGVQDKGASTLTLDGRYVMDAQTEADRRVEETLLAALRDAYPSVALVGEETTEGALSRPSDREEGRRLARAPRSAAATAAASAACPWPPALRRVEASRVVVYVDPLDGTNEYAAGEREAVTVLLGVAVDGRPVAGVIHQPFFGYPGPGLGRTVWGGPGAGVHGLAPPPPPGGGGAGGAPRACINRNLRDERQEPCMAALGATTAVKVSATGYHWLCLLEGRADVSLMLRKASKKWDSCAGDALLTAAGGRVTDTVGRRYLYTADTDKVQNLCGLVGAADATAGLECLRVVRETVAPLGGYPLDVPDPSVRPQALGGVARPPGGWAALTVDMGGTLVSTSEPITDTYSRAALRHGVSPPPPGEIRAGFKRAFGQGPAEGLRYVGDGRPFWRRVVEEALGSDSEPLFEELYAHYSLPGAWAVAPGAVASLRRLRAAGVRVAVVSNWDDRLGELVAALGLAGEVDAVVGSAQHGSEKPDAGIFAAALAELGLPPEAAPRCVHLGDDRVNDVQGAASAGWGAALLWAPGPAPGRVHCFTELADEMLL